MGWILLIAAIAVAAVLPSIIESRRIRVDVRNRATTTANFAELPQGITAYRWIGPVRGPVAIMVHGLTTSSIGFDDLASGLGNLGYRVLVYDLYGRGLSDAPDGLQDRAFFLRQLDDLLSDQKLTEDITLIGYSMGGSIVTAFAAQQPHRIKRVILLATAGIQTNESAFSRFCRRTPLIGDWLHNGIGAFRMSRALSKESGITGKLLTAQKAALRQNGFLRSVLASRRGMLDETLEKEHRAIGKSGVPVVAIWGVEDSVIPLSAMGQLAQWNRTARQDEISNAGHGLPFTNSADIVDILRTVFRED